MCEARTRKGTPCKRPARLPVGHCKLHGGASTGPGTEEGRARLT
ncbi:MAG: HGGxSTG domain-containing protein, partial [Phaeobacter gallaeciensis]